MNNSTRSEDWFAFVTLAGTGGIGLVFYGVVSVVLIDLARQMVGFRFLLSHAVADLLALVAFGKRHFSSAEVNALRDRTLAGISRPHTTRPHSRTRPVNHELDSRLYMAVHVLALSTRGSFSLRRHQMAVLVSLAQYPHLHA